MPTAAKLAAGVLYAALAWVVSGMVLPLLPEGTDPGRMAEINAAVGFVFGWRVAGSRAGTTIAGAISYGVTAAVAVTAVALFVHSLIAMLRDAWGKVYDGPVEAVVGIFQTMIAQFQVMATGPILATILIGGVAAGLVTEWVGRNFR